MNIVGEYVAFTKHESLLNACITKHRGFHGHLHFEIKFGNVKMSDFSHMAEIAN